MVSFTCDNIVEIITSGVRREKKKRSETERERDRETETERERATEQQKLP